MSEYNVRHDSAIHIYGAVQDLLNVNLINEIEEKYDVLRLKNGYLTFSNSKSDIEDFTELAEYLIK